jgi:hypothetical protein
MTRRGVVYHLGEFDDYESALERRRFCEDRYNQGLSFEYVHRYSSSPYYVDSEGDPVLFFFETQFTHYPDDVERNVRLAVLVQAIRDFLANHLQEHPDRADAEEWIFSDAEGTGFTFQDITGILRIDPDYLRGGLRRAVRDPRRILRAIGRHLVRTTQPESDY